MSPIRSIHYSIQKGGVRAFSIFFHTPFKGCIFLTLRYSLLTMYCRHVWLFVCFVPFAWDNKGGKSAKELKKIDKSVVSAGEEVEKGFEKTKLLQAQRKG